MQLGDVLEWLGIVGCGSGLAYLLVRERQGRQALIVLQERLALLNRATRELRADSIKDARDPDKTEVDTKNPDPNATVRMTEAELEEAAQKGRRSRP